MRTGWLAALFAIGGCTYPDYGFGPRDSGTGDSGPDVAADAGPLTCPTKGGAMINLGSYCIDEAEVTVASYREFLAAKAGDITGQIAVCSWNTKYEPPPAWWPPADKYAQYPVTGVDWCDAQAFCAWAGKRLCGGFNKGPSTGPNDPKKNQWYHACSGGGVNVYPYGGGYDAQKCNGAKYDAGADVKWDPLAAEEGGLVPVKSAASCTGPQAPFDKVHDLAGNAWEWTDDCNGATGATDDCRKRGGGFLALTESSTCTASPSLAWTARKTQASDIGFRCCAD